VDENQPEKVELVAGKVDRLWRPSLAAAELHLLAVAYVAAPRRPGEARQWRTFSAWTWAERGWWRWAEWAELGGAGLAVLGGAGLALD